MSFATTLPIMTDPERIHRSVIGAKIQRLRKAHGWSQEDLGASIGRQQSRIAKWETGQGKPSPQDILRLADALQVSLRFLCDDMQKEYKPESENPPSVATEIDDDMRMLLYLVKRHGAKQIVDRWLDSIGTAAPSEHVETEPPGPAKLLSVSKRSFKTNPE